MRISHDEQCDRRLASVLAIGREQSIMRKGCKVNPVILEAWSAATDPNVHTPPQFKPCYFIKREIRV